MNKKNIFLGLAVLFCASQVSAGWRDSVKSAWDNAAGWVVSQLPESWQGHACVTLGVCSLMGAGYLMSRSSDKGRVFSPDEIAKVEQEFSEAVRYDYGFGIDYKTAVANMKAVGLPQLMPSLKGPKFQDLWGQFINENVFPYIINWKTREQSLARAASGSMWRRGWTDENLITAYNVFDTYSKFKPSLPDAEGYAVERMAHTVKKIWIDRKLKGR